MTEAITHSIESDYSAKNGESFRTKTECESCEVLFPFLAYFLLEPGAQGVDRRKAVAPGIGSAGIQYGAAVDEVAGVALIGMHGRIERRAPAAVDNADGGLGIATSR